MKTLTKIPIPSFLIALIFALACFALLSQAQAVSPAPDGGYLNFNTAEGTDALHSLTTGPQNTATGFRALYLNTTGGRNSASGFEALYRNTTGGNNAATGWRALFSNTTGSFNTANGHQALYSNTANSNTGIGYQALYSNTTGEANTALGFQALFHNQAPTSMRNGSSANTGIGYQALYSTTTGIHNTAIGSIALSSNTTGSRNNATGLNALTSNTTGGHNIAYGNSTLTFNTTGSFNIGLGYGAGDNLTAGDNNVYIANLGVAAESNTVRIGNQVATMEPDGSTEPAHTATFIAGISGQTVSSGVAVYINSDGKLGTLTSSARFKTDINPMDEASEGILALKPVTFRYKKEIDPAGTSQFGLVAEDVEKVNRDLVVRDKEGKPYSVRYDQVNAMLLNEFLKEHRKVEQMEKQIEALTAGLQKVSAQLEASKPAPQTVLNNQ